VVATCHNQGLCEKIILKRELLSVAGCRTLGCLTAGSPLRQDPVCGIFPYSSPDMGAEAALLPARPRWSYHSNQLFHSSLILCSFCWSPRHDYSIGQSLSACGAGPASGRSPGWLLCISHAQRAPLLAGWSRGRSGGWGVGLAATAALLSTYRSQALLMLQAY
jgi:hypothetical protein